MRKVMPPMLLLACLLGTHAVVVAEEMQSVTITGKRPISWWEVVDMRQARDSLAESYAKDIRSDPREGPRDGKTTNPAAQGGSKITCTTDNPVVITTGEKILPENDFQAGGAYGLGLRRVYRSKNATGSMFGPQWLSNIDHPRLIQDTNKYCYTNGNCVPKTVTHTRPDGTKFVYTLVIESGNTDSELITEAKKRRAAAGETTNAVIGASYDYLVKTSPTSSDGAQSTGVITYFYNTRWELARLREFYTYSATGYIQSYSDSLGAKTTFGYQGTKVVSITSPAGKALVFGYGANGLVNSVKDPAGYFWTYEYNSNNMLSKMISPGTTPDVREYLYESPVSATLLTGLKINGVRYSTYSYYGNGLVQESALANGKEKDTFEYSAGTTITDIRGQTTTYGLESIQGELKISSVSRNATATCAAANAKTVYDANGFVDYTEDWEGHRTDYTYDDTGRLLNYTTAAGTNDLLAVVNTWLFDQITSTEYRGGNGIAYARVTYTYMGDLVKSETWDDLKTNRQRKVVYDYTLHPSNVVASVTATRSLPGATAVSTRLYDTSGNLTGHTNYLGQTETWSSYNSMGQPGRHTNLNGVNEDYGYEPKGNMHQSTLRLPAGSRVTKFAYNNNHQVTDI
jgi:YD repeat-containing protein